MDDNFYEILNVDENSTVDEIKKQYKILALKHHPDKNNGDETYFKKISNAYENLSDVVKRSEYDKKHHYPILDEINGMRDFFSNTFDFHEEQQKITINLDISDILYGCYKKYVVKVILNCRECRTTGIMYPEKNTIQCRECFGKGANPMIPFLSCMSCNSKGIFIVNNIICKTCDGRGIIYKYEEKTIYIKPGTKHDDKIQISKHLVLLLEHQLHEKHIYFIGNDIHYKLDLTLLELLCGFVKEIKYGEEMITIRSLNIFDYNKEIVLNRKGICNFGNLILHFNLIIEVDLPIYKKLGRALTKLLKVENDSLPLHNVIHIN
jgi:DnaJ-class molecular chaperone